MSPAGDPRPVNGQPTASAVDPVSRFLGPRAHRDGPFGVLGLEVARVGEAEVLEALHAAMTRIDRHPESRTPAADEARLALHAAAANLLDRAVLDELLRRLGRRSSTPSRAAVASGTVELEAALIRSIAVEGGWGRRAMHRFIKVAHARGHSSAMAFAAIRRLARPGSAAAPVVTQARPPDSPARSAGPAPASPGPRPVVSGHVDPSAAPAEPPPGGREEASPLSPVSVVLLVVTVLVLMLAGAWVAVSMVGSPEAGSEAPAAAPPPAPRAIPPAPEPPPEPDATSRPLDNGPAIVHEFEVAVEGLGVDIEGSMAAFEAAHAAIAERWVDLSTADQLAAQDHVVGFLYRVSGQSSLSGRAMDAVEAGVIQPVRTAQDAARAAWSMGMLVRLRREQNLPSTVMRRIDRVMLRAPQGLEPNAATFRAGAIASLRASADALASGVDASRAGELWSAWARAVVAATSGDEALAESVMLSAIEAVLRSPSGVEGGGVGPLVSELSWRQGGAARGWFLRAFGDRSMSVADLHALTLALATRSRAEGVDHSLVLPRNASEYARREMGERFRALWGIEAGADQGEAIAAFHAAAAAIAPDAAPSARDELEVLASVVRLARLNAVAALLWRADTAEATGLLTSLDGPVDAVRSVAGTPDVTSLFAPSTGAWAESYLDAGSHIPRRLELLGVLSARSGRIEPMEAEVVVNEAVRGSPQPVRDAAAAVVERAGSQAAVVNAVLEALPLMPRTDRNARLVELTTGSTLPPADARGWEAEARRALVERLLHLIAGHGVYARLDAMAVLLDEAYAVRLQGVPISSASGGPAPAAVSARALADRWSADAESRPPSGLAGLGVDEIERRRAARLAMASGLVQRFHAEQLALLEAMAAAVASEQPDRRDEVGSLHESVRVDRARVTSVLVQIESAERAMLRLWQMRFGEGGA